MGAMKLSPVHPAHSRSAEDARLSSAQHAQGPQAQVTGTFVEYPSVAARLALVFASLGTRGSLSFFCSLGWLLWMLYMPLLVIR